MNIAKGKIVAVHHDHIDVVIDGIHVVALTGGESGMDASAHILGCEVAFSNCYFPVGNDEFKPRRSIALD